MALNGPIQFELTLKGNEELAARTYRLDVKLRNILFLIQKGCASFDGILQNSIFPREEVLERLRNLINEKFIALAPVAAAAAAPGAQGTAKPAAPPTRPAAGLATVETGAAVQARAALPATAPAAAQPDAQPPARPGAPAPAPAVAAPARAPEAPSLRANTRHGPPTVIGDFPLLNPAASMTQARFVLGDFCLDAFGIRGQEYVDLAQKAQRIGALQSLLDDIVEHLRRTDPGQIAELAARVDEINETAA